MARASNIIMAYFVIGVVMWGGGVVGFGDAGVATIFFDQDQDGISTDDEASQNLDEQTGIIQQLAALAVGGLVFVVNLVTIFIQFLNWPIFVLLQNNAPPVMTVLLGGSFSAGFYLSMFSLIR